jgi:L-threonylcarbamoyladenylate synthase
VAATGPAASSANLSGRPVLAGREDLIRTFGDLVAVYLVAAAEAPRPGPPSTVVDLTGPEPVILRRGLLEPEVILAACR